MQNIPAHHLWYQRPAARALLSSLTEQDLMIWYGYDDQTGQQVYYFRAATDHGQRVIERLEHLCNRLPNGLFKRAKTDEQRLFAMELARTRVSAQGALQSRFGDANRWRPLSTGDATRCFRGGFADETAWHSERRAQLEGEWK